MNQHLIRLGLLLVVSCSRTGGDARTSDAGATPSADAEASGQGTIVADGGPRVDAAGPSDTGNSTATRTSSSLCGPKEGTCDPARSAACRYCDSAGDPWLCRCVAGKWQCGLGDGTCGVACGDRRCLPDELCQELHEGQGTPGAPGAPQFVCQPTPPQCPSGRPSCACAAAAIPRCSAADVCSCSDTQVQGRLRCDCRNPNQGGPDPIPCGATTCTPTQVCVHPGGSCGAPPICQPVADGGTCPIGMVACADLNTGRAGCSINCQPSPPYCLDVPAACRNMPTCACLPPSSCACRSVSNGRVLCSSPP